MNGKKYVNFFVLKIFKISSVTYEDIISG